MKSIDLLNWRDLKGFLDYGSGRKVFPKAGTPFAQYIKEGGYRSPSQKWPLSHVQPLFTKKFAAWLVEKHPDFAHKIEESRQ
jgi:hypothetical protein